MLRAVLLLLLARGRATHAFSHPRRSDVYGGGADTLVEDHREYDAFGELRHVNENDASYTDADVSSPDAWSRANDARRAARSPTPPRAPGRAGRTRTRTRAWRRARCLAASTRATPRSSGTNRSTNTNPRPSRVTRVAPAHRRRRAAGRSRAVDGGPFAWPAPTGRETCRFFHVLDRPASTDTPHDTHTSAFASGPSGGSGVRRRARDARHVGDAIPEQRLARPPGSASSPWLSAPTAWCSARTPARRRCRAAPRLRPAAFFEYVDSPRPVVQAEARTTPPARTRAGRAPTVTVNRARAGERSARERRVSRAVWT